MVSSVLRLILAIVLGGGGRAYAYTLEIRCDEAGRLLEHKFKVSSVPDLAKNQRHLNPAARPRDTCRDFKTCFGELSDVARLARDTSDILQRYEAEYEAVSGWRPAPAQVGYHGEVARLQELLGDCVNYRGLRLSDPSRGALTLFYPFDGPLSGKVSRNYEKEPLAQLIKQAV